MSASEDVVEISEQHLLGDVTKFVVDMIRQQTTPYVALPPEEQKLIVDRVQRMCREAVAQAVNIIASKNMPRVDGEIKNVSIGDSGWVVKLLVGKSQGARHELADAIGDKVTLVLPPWAEVNAGKAPRVTAGAVDATMTLPGIPPGEGDLSQTGAAKIADDLLRKAAADRQQEPPPDGEGSEP